MPNLLEIAIKQGYIPGGKPTTTSRSVPNVQTAPMIKPTQPVQRSTKSLLQQALDQGYQPMPRTGLNLMELSQRPPQPEQPSAGGVFNKVADTAQKIGGGVGNFLFGNIAKTVGAPIVAGVGSAMELAGSQKGTQIRQKAEEVIRNKEGNVSVGKTLLTPALGALESTPLGVGEGVAEKVASKFSAPLMARAERIYRSVLKPGKEIMKRYPEVIQTGLKEGVRVTEGGLNKVTTIMDDIGENIGKIIEEGKNAGKVVKTNELYKYANEGAEYLKNVAAPEDLVKEWGDKVASTIGGLQKRFGDSIPIDKAQEIKQATQSFLRKFYGKEAPLSKEVQKQVTRGIKEEIASAVPEISALNARDRQLFGLEQAVESALSRMGNKNIFSLYDLGSTAIGVASGNVKKAVGLIGLIKALGGPAVKSQVAIITSRLAENGAKALKGGRIPFAIASAKLIELFNSDE